MVYFLEFRNLSYQRKDLRQLSIQIKNSPVNH